MFSFRRKNKITKYIFPIHFVENLEKIKLENQVAISNLLKKKKHFL